MQAWTTGGTCRANATQSGGMQSSCHDTSKYSVRLVFEPDHVSAPALDVSAASVSSAIVERCLTSVRTTPGAESTILSTGMSLKPRSQTIACAMAKAALRTKITSRAHTMKKMFLAAPIRTSPPECSSSAPSSRAAKWPYASSQASTTVASGVRKKSTATSKAQVASHKLAVRVPDRQCSTSRVHTACKVPETTPLNRTL